MKEWRRSEIRKEKDPEGGKPLPSRQRVINVWVIRRKRPSITGQESNQSPSIIFLSHICISYVAGCWIISSIRGENKNKKQKHAGPFFVCSANTSPRHPDKVWHRHPNQIRIAWTFRQSYNNNNNRESSPFARATVQLNFKWTSWHQRKKEEGKRCYIYARLNIIVPLLGRDIRLLLRLGENGKTKVEDRFRIEPLD